MEASIEYRPFGDVFIKFRILLLHDQRLTQLMRYRNRQLVVVEFVSNP